MAKQAVWVLIDVAAGVLVAGLVAPAVMVLLPQAYRGPVTLAGLALAAVAAVGVLRRALGLGRPAPRG